MSIAYICLSYSVLLFQIKPLVKPTRIIMDLPSFEYSWHDLISKSEFIIGLYFYDLLFYCTPFCVYNYSYLKNLGPCDVQQWDLACVIVKFDEECFEGLVMHLELRLCVGLIIRCVLRAEQ